MKYLSLLSMGGLVLVSSIAITNPAHATIYKCVKTSGEVFYNDKPCAAIEVETTLKHEKTPKNPYIPPTDVVLTDLDETNTKSSLSTVVGKQNEVVNSNQQQNAGMLNNIETNNQEMDYEENDQGLLDSESDLVEIVVSKEKQAEIARLAQLEKESIKD